MESGLLSTHILSSLPNGIQSTFSTPARARRTKGTPCFAQKSLEERAQQNRCADAQKCRSQKGSVPKNSSTGNCPTNGCTIDLRVCVSLLYITASVQRLRKGCLVLSKREDCRGFYAFIIIVPLGERDRKK